MFWISSYAVVAMVSAVAVFLLAEWLREPGVPAPNHPGRFAVIAGLLWPVLAVGIAQWGLIAAVAARLGETARPAGADGSRGIPQPAAR